MSFFFFKDYEQGLAKAHNEIGSQWQIERERKRPSTQRLEIGMMVSCG